MWNRVGSQCISKKYTRWISIILKMFTYTLCSSYSLQFWYNLPLHYLCIEDIAKTFNKKKYQKKFEITWYWCTLKSIRPLRLGYQSYMDMTITINIYKHSLFPLRSQFQRDFISYSLYFENAATFNQSNQKEF